MANLQLQQLKGNFHAHITILHNGDFKRLSGWKNTIILLSKDSQYQTDVMLTRHFRTNSHKTPDVYSILKVLDKAKMDLQSAGHKVVRVKLEHESLPTLNVSNQHYRECHIKYKVPHGEVLKSIGGFVPSSNPMSVHDSFSHLFLNKRVYEGDCQSVDDTIRKQVQLLSNINPNCTLIEVKIETTVWDSNLNHDKWWA